MRNRQQGFTFVELLLVIFVLLAASAGILGSYFSTHFLSQYARETLMATDDLRDMMERINATSYNALTTNFPAGVANGPSNAYQRIVAGVNPSTGLVNPYSLTGESMTVTYPPPQSSAGVEILVTVTWTSRGGQQRTASLTGFRTSS